MSRSLDADTAANLNNDDPESIYHDISKAISPDPQFASLLEIEFLGKSHPVPLGTNLLIDGNSIAIPKAKLVQAFIHARRLFFDHLRQCPQDRNEDLLKATAILLLMDPEHLTAANSRKRLIQSYQSAPSIEFQAVLKRELLFVDSYLTSRLHRHTKSPTLWSHRKWLLETSKEASIEYDLERDLKEVVLVAAERHPRNYYAWLHLRWLVQVSEQFGQLQNLLVIKTWCLRHPNDTSGFSFLLFYLDSVGPLRSDASNNIFREVLNLAQSFKWTNETVWVFLRTLVSSGVVGEQKLDFLESIHFLTAASSENSAAISTLQTAANWYEKNGRELQS